MNTQSIITENIKNFVLKYGDVLKIHLVVKIGNYKTYTYQPDDILNNGWLTHLEKYIDTSFKIGYTLDNHNLVNKCLDIYKLLDKNIRDTNAVDVDHVEFAGKKYTRKIELLELLECLLKLKTDKNMDIHERNTLSKILNPWQPWQEPMSNTFTNNLKLAINSRYGKGAFLEGIEYDRQCRTNTERLIESMELVWKRENSPKMIDIKSHDIIIESIKKDNDHLRIERDDYRKKCIDLKKKNDELEQKMKKLESELKDSEEIVEFDISFTGYMDEDNKLTFSYLDDFGNIIFVTNDETCDTHPIKTLEDKLKKSRIKHDKATKKIKKLLDEQKSLKEKIQTWKNKASQADIKEDTYKNILNSVGDLKLQSIEQDMQGYTYTLKATVPYGTPHQTWVDNLANMFHEKRKNGGVKDEKQ